MLLATMVLMFSAPQAGIVTATEKDPSAAVTAEPSEASAPSNSLPSMPTPKVSSDANAAEGVGSVPSVTAAVQPGIPSPAIQPVKPVYSGEGASSRQRKEWLGLVVVSHSAAVFDAWTTQRDVSEGYTEANPFLKPFAKSNAIYAATQVSPVVMDYIGKRMMSSRYPAIRKLWWLPQVAGAGFSIGAGVHNYGMVH